MYDKYDLFDFVKLFFKNSRELDPAILFQAEYNWECLWFCELGNCAHDHRTKQRYRSCYLEPNSQRRTFMVMSKSLPKVWFRHCGKNYPVFLSLCVKSRSALPAFTTGATTGGATFGETDLRAWLWKMEWRWSTAWPTLIFTQLNSLKKNCITLMSYRVKQTVNFM